MTPFMVTLLVLVVKPVRSIDPTAVVRVEKDEIMASVASFGAALPEKSKKLELTLLEAGSGGELRDGCTLNTTWWQAWWQKNRYGDGFAVLAARSPNCTFVDRALAVAEAGGTAIVVYDTIEGIYRNRSAAEAGTDYDCDRAESWITMTKSTSYQKARLEGFQDSDCAQQCESKRCLLTGTIKASQAQVCCAWDTYLRMASTSEPSTNSKDSIFAVYLRMVDYDLISSYLSHSVSNTIPCRLWDSYDARAVWFSSLVSSFFIWILGVATCAFAAKRSSDDIEALAKHGVQASRRETLNSDMARDPQDSPESLELTTSHAIGFIVVASVVLVLLFYLDASKLVVFVFTLSATAASFTVATRPLSAYLIKKFSAGDRSLHFLRLPGMASSSTPNLVDVLAAIVSGSLAIWWLSQHNNPRAGPMGAWILQDFFGICLCVLFLKLVQLNSLKVAAMLLGLALCYDVFFVFLTPYLFNGQSVMVTVASGRGPSRDADYCDKYPDDADCASTQLPMLLLLPESFTGNDGYAMLGLGDIVLPGLLLAFTARHEAANRIINNEFMATHTNRRNTSASPGATRTYFPLLIFGYAVGLACANLAVAVFNFGQPALLYLVPSTLGLLLIVANNDGTFSELWRGPPELSPSWLHDFIVKRRTATGLSVSDSSIPLQQSHSYQDGVEATPVTENHALLRVNV